MGGVSGKVCWGGGGGVQRECYYRQDLFLLPSSHSKNRPLTRNVYSTSMCTMLRQHQKGGAQSLPSSVPSEWKECDIDVQDSKK